MANFKRPSAIVVLGLLIMLAGVLAQENTSPVIVGAPFVGERLLTEQGSGFWGDLYQSLTLTIETETSLVILPFKRLMDTFKEGAIDCIWTLDAALLERYGLDAHQLVESEVVFESTRHIFFTTGLGPIQNLSELHGKRVGIGVGSNYEIPLTEVGAEVFFLQGQGSRLKMLESGRLDAVIGWLPDILISGYQETADQGLVRRAFKLNGTKIVFTCHRNDESQAFIQKVNAVIGQYRHSEDFQALFRDYGAERMLEVNE